MINSWERSYTVVDRMLKGQKVIVPGDGSSLWVITHDSDFAKGFIGLLGHEQAIGHAFHITTDEVLTWDQLYRIVAAAAGVEARHRAHSVRFHGGMSARDGRHADRRQVGKRGVRQQQDQALCAGLCGDDAVLHRAFASRWPGSTPIRRAS